jgi:DNA-3-methyladenine glycosylase I
LQNPFVRTGFFVTELFSTKSLGDSKSLFNTDANMNRCSWARDEKNIAYHDKEWGVPSHDDRHLFEMLILEGAQAGLSWSTILNKRENYRRAFDHFDARKIAKYDSRKVKKLLADPGIVRNRLKVNAAIQNAKAFLEVQKEFGSFDAYLWQFVGGRPIRNRRKTMKEVPARTAESDAMSKDLLKRGFKFVGSTICYALMQAVGMVNDHTVDCFRYWQIQ